MARDEARKTPTSSSTAHRAAEPARAVVARLLALGLVPLLALSAAPAASAAALPRSAVAGPQEASAAAPDAPAALPRLGTTPATVESHDPTSSGVVVVADGFQTAAVTWPSDLDPAVPELRLRARAVDGAWGPWIHVERSADGADSGSHSEIVTSSTVYVGQSEEVQVSTVEAGAVLPEGIRVTTVSSALTGSPTARRSGPVTEARTTDAATASVAGPAIVTREQWGAAPASCAWDSAPALKGGTVHHTVNANDYTTTAQLMQIIRNDQAFHQAEPPKGNGWCDLGYNFLVDKWGNVYEGADSSIESALIGAHTGGFNTGTVGVAMVGTFTSVTPTDAQLDGVARIIAFRLAQYGVDPAGSTTFTAASKTAGGRFEAGQSVVLPRIFGHRDTHQTECPGTLAYGKLARIRELAAGHYQAFRAEMVERVSGANRYATSAAISAATFEPGARVAYVANGLAFPDALSGGAAAVVSGAPVLLVAPGAVPAPVAAELRRLRPQEIVVLGGSGVVSGTVVAQLSDLATTGTVTRLAGTDRYATSAAISSATFAPAVPVVYVANGLAFPDALSAAPVAGAAGAPVLLVGPTSVPASVEAELRRLQPDRIVVLGGTGSVSEAVAGQLGALASKGVARTSGSDRFGTSAAVSAAAFSPGVPVVYVANGLDFPDSLSGAAAAGAAGGPVLLTSSSRVPAAVAAELDRLDPAQIVVLGGSGVVSDAVRASLAGYEAGQGS
ncbi:putative cell wall-binding protein [Cellulosimicrobium cellulans]|uniref:cell wall-binding repeat-containing protein n=1 Tax=Cellulosimicrobium cellulans TaxID=1710 RepID=UPI0014315D85|nr:cell wall-binding repeat-containing protein [Cellulosimicrobium cellulans]MBM7820865.1 putative cell wall-binding protein [Cellulosimicrobium cellulans]